MDTKGRMLRCDRCGKEIFTKYLGEETRDGGFSRWDKFYRPEGWCSAYINGPVDFCPVCTEAYNAMGKRHKQETEEFLEGKE